MFHLTFERIGAVIACAMFLFSSFDSIAQTCDADAGTMTAYKDVECFPYDLIGGIPHGNAVVPAGFQTSYLLTENAGLTIIGTGSNTIFQVGAVGSYAVHTLVHDPSTLDLGTIQLGTTTAFDVETMLIQGGGNICGSLDMVGAPTVVVDPQAGTMSTANPNACLVGGVAQLDAIVNGDAAVPNGYMQEFILSDAQTSTILEVAAMPSFTVNSIGAYKIHSMVYDIMMNPLGAIQIGTSSVSDLYAVFGPGGGPMCGMLDAVGVQIDVQDCMPTCDADAGTISANGDTLCLNGGVTLSAQPDANALVPPGYDEVYILTTGNDLTVQAINTIPAFTAMDTGTYAIHTLVRDIGTMNLSFVVPGVTSAFDIHGMLLQGGGVICGSLDLAGAHFLVIACHAPCPVNAGSLLAIGDGVCPWENVEAVPSGHVVPTGFEVAYLLSTTQFGIILEVDTQPVFQPMVPDTYMISTLVYDPNTLPIAQIIPGATSLDAVEATLLQGGGETCAALDTIGATILVNECDPLALDDTSNDSTIVSLNASISPNPVITDLGVSIEPLDTEPQVVTVQLVDALGRPRVSEVVPLNGSPTTVNLPATGLERGNYLMQIISQEGKVMHGEVVSKEE